MSLIGHYFRWWVKGDFPVTKKSHAGFVMSERPGWSYWITVLCNDGIERSLCLSTSSTDGVITYKPEYIWYTKQMESVK